MAQFSKDEVSFVKELPEHVEIECPVCLNILTDPHLVSCCGHNFCGSCIERVKAGDGSCPMCKEKKYQAMVDKKCSRIINGLEVYCSNKEKGCQWKGGLKNMSTHLNKEKREGECQYEEVKCSRYEKCQEKKHRRYLKYHEDDECLQRPFQCQYCGEEGIFLSITKDHYEECRYYPVTCPKKCSFSKVPRYQITENIHINECPLEPVDCVFSWAGCNDKPLRKDVHEHTADTKHMALLAIACGQLKKENEQLKEENEKIKKEMRKNNDKIQEAKEEIEKLRRIPIASLLPVDIRNGSEAVHFYTGECDQHMSARVMLGHSYTSSRLLEYPVILFAFHQGQFDKDFQILPKIFGKLTYKAITWPMNKEGVVKVDKDISLLADTETTCTTYKQLPHDILNTIINCEGILPQEVIKIELPNHMFFMLDSVTIYTKCDYFKQI